MFNSGKQFLRSFHIFRALLKEKPNLKGKKHSSQQWLSRQFQDPYVEKARQLNYRCRSAFKLLEINKRHRIFSPGLHVVDCGAAPGSWTQVATHLTNATGKMFGEQVGKVIAIDKLPIHPIEGATVFGNLDFTTEVAQNKLKEALDGKYVELVMSDMAPNATGVRDLDHEGIIRLAYTAFKFAVEVTCYEGTFIVKVWDGYKSQKLEEDLAKFYRYVKIARPEATREESSEKFIIARGFKGLRTKPDS